MTAHMNTRTVDCLLQQFFAAGVSWPIDRASLRALFDLGLTFVRIALYFSIDPIEVQELLNRH
jgi:hypothetical protein